MADVASQTGDAYSPGTWFHLSLSMGSWKSLLHLFWDK